MNLSPSPKPVKVRITSGGIEHSSLDNLLNRFKWEDLEKNEEQVRRWLLRQGPKGTSIASQWKKGQKANNAAGLFEIYKIFFNLKQEGIYSIDNLFDRWSKDKDGETANFKFLLDSLLSLDYKKAKEYVKKSSGNILLDPIEKNMNNTKEQAKNDSINKAKNCDSNPDLDKKSPYYKSTLNAMRPMERKTDNSDSELIDVFNIADSCIKSGINVETIVSAQKAFGLSDLRNLTTRKDKTAAFFIALLKQGYYKSYNHSYSLSGIGCCEKYNYMAQLLSRGEVYRKFKCDPKKYMTKTLSLFKFPQKVNETFMSKPEIINWHAEMGAYQLEMLWKFFCENIYILEIK